MNQVATDHGADPGEDIVLFCYVEQPASCLASTGDVDVDADASGKTSGVPGTAVAVALVLAAASSALALAHW
eukprot:SAG22_NODE_94_length_20824_cov_230.693718_10_plen_72_part_00